VPVDKAFADALADLSLEPLGADGTSWDDSLIAGYNMPETGASSPQCACLPCGDFCSCCSCIDQGASGVN
jgi:hypothetical protein